MTTLHLFTQTYHFERVNETPPVLATKGRSSFSLSQEAAQTGRCKQSWRVTFCTVVFFFGNRFVALEGTKVTTPTTWPHLLQTGPV